MAKRGLQSEICCSSASARGSFRPDFCVRKLEALTQKKNIEINKEPKEKFPIPPIKKLLGEFSRFNRIINRSLQSCPNLCEGKGFLKVKIVFPVSLRETAPKKELHHGT
jgi:hypothetical protein